LTEEGFDVRTNSRNIDYLACRAMHGRGFTVGWHAASGIPIPTDQKSDHNP